MTRVLSSSGALTESKRRWKVGVVVGAALCLAATDALSLKGPNKPARSVLDGVEFAPVRPLTSVATPTSSALDMACTELEYELHVGRALDQLRKDYPHILTEQPDFSIFDSGIEVIDPSGVKVHGLQSYKNAFRLVHTLVKVFYCPSRSMLTFRMCYDKARENIRIHWNAEVVPREIFGGSRTTAYFDGISVYEIDRQSGNITQHRIEKLLRNNMPIMPKEGVIAALRRETAVQVPSFFKESSNTVMKFQAANPLSTLLGARRSSLFAVEASADDSSEQFPDLDWDALERKNKSRKKFGLKELTPEEFLEVEAQVKQMETQQRQKASTASAAAEMANNDESRGGFLEKLFGKVLTDTCESNFDCQRPEVCCDFGFQKKCCSSGSPVFDGAQLVRVPAYADMGENPMDGLPPPRKF